MTTDGRWHRDEDATGFSDIAALAAFGDVAAHTLEALATYLESDTMTVRRQDQDHLLGALTNETAVTGLRAPSTYGDIPGYLHSIAERLASNTDSDRT